MSNEVNGGERTKKCDSKRRIHYYLGCLNEISFSKVPRRAEIAVSTFFSGLRNDGIGFLADGDSNHSLAEQLCDEGAFIVLSKVLSKRDQTPNFYHKVVSSIFFLAAEREHHWGHFFDSNGLDNLLDLMRFLCLDEFLMTSCVYTLTCFMQHANPQTIKENADRVIQEAVYVMNFHRESAAFYKATCDLLSYCFPPGAHVEDTTFHEAVRAVWYGVTSHNYEEHAQRAGRYALRHMVGEKTAKLMIDHSEYHHCSSACCSGAA